jgi:hypothetical protein
MNMTNATKFITISTDLDAWGDTNAAPDFNVNHEVEQIRDAAESCGILVLVDETPRDVRDSDGNELNQIDWFTTWCREGWQWTESQWREWFRN